MRVRSVFKTVFWVAAAIFLLLVVLLLALAGINWKDKPPSAAAQRMENALNGRPMAGAAQNGYVHMLALNAPPGHDVVEVGTARMAWIEQLSAKGSAASEFPDRLMQADTKPAPELAPLLAACKDLDAVCEQAALKDPKLVEEWMTAEKGLTERYDAMLATTSWYDAVLTDPSMPLPPYLAALNGQRNLFLRAWTSARGGDAGEVQELLMHDMAFWRRAHASSSTLIGKMMAVTALTRHFKWSSMVLRSLPAERQTAALPAQWRSAFSQAELSMQLAMAGEYKFAQHMFGKGVLEEGVQDWPKFMFHRLAGYQKQDSLNRYAEFLVRLVDTMHVAHADMPLAYARAQTEKPDISHRSISEKFYNITGKMLVSADYGMAGYAVRVADLEGIRRAALLAAQLRAERVPVDKVPARLSTAELRDPYTGQPFGWNAAARTVIFTGLGKATHGKSHSIFY